MARYLTDAMVKANNQLWKKQTFGVAANIGDIKFRRNNKGQIYIESSQNLPMDALKVLNERETAIHKWIFELYKLEID